MRAKQGSLLGEVWIHGKLLYALVIERRLHKRFDYDWNRLDQPRLATPWRLLKRLRDEVNACILEVHRIREDNRSSCFEVMMERPCARQLQTMPARVTEILGMA